jgi:DNA polymerase I
VPEYNPILNFRNEEKIISIKHLDHNDFVYDITVEDDHSFLANGLFTHNCYGASVNGFRGYAESNYGISLSEKEAKTIMDNFFKSYEGLAKWHKITKSKIYNHNQGINETRTLSNRKGINETRTLSNRRRFFDNASPQQILNTPIQGTGADILKSALANLITALKPYGDKVKLLATVHDEIILEAHESIASEIAKILSDTMVNSGKEFLKKVPIEADSSIGNNWSDK